MPEFLRAHGVLPVTGALAVFMLLLALWPGSLPALGYERGLIAEGELWRLLSAHLVHLNLNHALLNMSGLLMLGYYFRHDFSPASWLGLIALAGLVISAGLWWAEPALRGYAGFSGVLHALLYAGLVRTWKEMPWLNSLVLALLLGRLCWEHSAYYDENYLRGLINGRVIPNAHLFGALTGLAWGLATTGWSALRPGRAQSA